LGIQSLCVYCAASPHCDVEFLEQARVFGEELARRGIALVYGAGSTGLMGAVADGALDAGGRVVGVIPGFMKEREWNHPDITETHVVDGMHERKQRMIDLADGFVALPGGSGTIEELTECISLRRLGLHHAPIIVANWKGFYQPLLDQFQAVFDGQFLEPEFRGLWQSAEDLAGLLAAVEGPDVFEHPWKTEDSHPPSD